MRKIISYLITAAVIGIVFASAQPEPELLRVGNAVFEVEIADTDEERARGLSGRDFLEEKKGMLFLFPSESAQTFWMKDMKFPIDIIWIRGGRVIGMAIGAEPEQGPDYALYTSPEPVGKVLEINAGLTSRLGIKIGDSVEW